MLIPFERCRSIALKKILVVGGKATNYNLRAKSLKLKLNSEYLLKLILRRDKRASLLFEMVRTKTKVKVPKCSLSVNQIKFKFQDS